MAEDALSTALAAALRHWPARGIPDRPQAWLLAVARRELGHAERHRGVQAAAEATLVLLHRPDVATEALGDRRLELMLACAHPGIEKAAQAPLMLQVVLGIDPRRIAASFLVSPGAMAQRLVRAKRRIRELRLAFELPGLAELGPRLESLLVAIYAAYGTGWSDLTGDEGSARGLSEEALWLARLVVALLPDAPEPKGLLSLMLHTHARRAARRDAAGRFVPLSVQDTDSWSAPMIAEAEALLREAAAAACPGRFQTEAAIQSLHVSARLQGRAAGPAAVALYDLLARFSPTVGVLVARAAAMAEAGNAQAALAALDALGEKAATYQPYWATRGHLLARMGHPGAADAFRRAAGLTGDAAVRDFLLNRSASLPPALG